MVDNSETIPIRNVDVNVIETEYSNVRERYEEAMLKMDADMKSFTASMLAKQRETFDDVQSQSPSQREQPGPSALRRITDALSKFRFRANKDASSSAVGQQASVVGRQNSGSRESQMIAGTSAMSRFLNQFLDQFDSPLVQTGSENNRVLTLQFDLSHFGPEDITLKTLNNKLLVMAKHAEKIGTRTVNTEYNREFILPPGVGPDAIKSTLSKDGVLTVEVTIPLAEENEEAGKILKITVEK